MCCAKEEYTGNSRFSLSCSAKLDGKKYQLNVHVKVRVKCLHNYQFTFNESNAAEIWNPNSESTDSLAITTNKQNHLSLSVNRGCAAGRYLAKRSFRITFGSLVEEAYLKFRTTCWYASSICERSVLQRCHLDV